MKNRLFLIFIMLFLFSASALPMESINTNSNNNNNTSSSASNLRIATTTSSLNPITSLAKIATEVIINNLICAKKIGHLTPYEKYCMGYEYYGIMKTLPDELKSVINERINQEHWKKIAASKKIFDVSKNQQLLLTNEGIKKLSYPAKPGIINIDKIAMEHAAFCKKNPSLIVYVQNSPTNSSSSSRLIVTNLDSKQVTAELSLKDVLLPKQQLEQIEFPSQDLVIARGPSTSRVYYWHPQTNPKELHACDFKPGIVNHSSSTPDHNIMFSKIFDGKNPAVYEATQNGCTPVKKWGSFSEAINDTIYSKNLVIAGSENKTVKVWDVREKGKEIAVLNHLKPVDSLQLEQEGEYLFVGTRMPIGKLHVWDLRKNQLLHEFAIESFNPTAFNKQLNALHITAPSGSVDKIWLNEENNSVVVRVSEYGEPELHRIRLGAATVLKKIASEYQNILDELEITR